MCACVRACVCVSLLPVFSVAISLYSFSPLAQGPPRYWPEESNAGSSLCASCVLFIPSQARGCCACLAFCACRAACQVPGTMGRGPGVEQVGQ